MTTVQNMPVQRLSFGRSSWFTLLAGRRYRKTLSWIALKLKMFLLLGGLFFLLGCKQVLYSGISERQANEMVALLHANSISVSRERDKDGIYSILVKENSVGSATMLLSSAGMPRETFKAFDDIFPGNSIVTTPFEERARHTFMMSQELGQTINEIRGVVSARIHLALPQDTGSFESNSRPRAAAAIYYNSNFDQANAVPRIKNLVSFSVPNLEYENISIGLFEANGISKIRIEEITIPGAAMASGFGAQKTLSGGPSQMAGLFLLVVIVSLIMSVLVTIALKMMRKLF